MLQLRETLKLVEKHYAAELERTGYFAAVTKGMLFAFAIDGKKNGSFTLKEKGKALNLLAMRGIEKISR